MAKATALIASALCFLAVAAAHDLAYQVVDGAATQNMFCVEGMVYCDACRVGFPVGISIQNDNTNGVKIGAAGVELQCRDRENGTVTATIATRTDDGGYYNIYVDQDHENDICEVHVKSSSMSDCNQIEPEISSVRVSLAENTGIVTKSRFANPIGFLRKEAHPDCASALDEMGFIPLI